jgi:copper chaperone CopZ
METLSFKLPAMYGDHHVVEVRRILAELPGVEDIYASSAFQAVEVTYDAAQVDAAAIESVLDNAGYLDPLDIPYESTEAVYYNRGPQDSYFRHTAAYQQTGVSVGFAQQVAYAGRPLWPCPGMGPVNIMDEGE